MGCFSYLCKKCGKGILSSSFDGQECIIFLLSKGKVIEMMEGRYDSYGKVFKKGGKHEYLLHVSGGVEESDEGSFDCFRWKHNEWGNLVDKQFNSNSGDGFAAFHKECFNGVLPTTQSGDDPNQGWGEDDGIIAEEPVIKELMRTKKWSKNAHQRIG